MAFTQRKSCYKEIPKQLQTQSEYYTNDYHEAQRHTNQSGFVFNPSNLMEFFLWMSSSDAKGFNENSCFVFISNSRHSHPEQNRKKTFSRLAKTLIKKLLHTFNKFWSSPTGQLMTPPTLSCCAADCDPLQNLDVSTSFGLLQILLDVQQQHLHCVNSILDVWDTVQDGERSSDVFTEQWLSAHRGQIGSSLKKKKKVLKKTLLQFGIS